MAEIIGNTIINLTSVDSTNNYATAHMANNNWNEGTVVLADEQSAGRGQINNKWESEFGKNILMSVVLYPEFLPVQYQFLLSKVIALSVSDVVGFYVDNVKIKWPNDIYVGNKKIAGILIENSIMGSTLSTSVLGLGLNVNQQKFMSDAPNPVSLYAILGQEVNRMDLLQSLFNRLNYWYGILKNRNLEILDNAYQQRMLRIDEVAEYKDENGRYVGRILGVNEIGQLRIQPEAGQIRCYHFKEVEFIFEK